MKKNYIIPQARLILLMEEAELMQSMSVPVDSTENVDDSSATRRQSFDSPWGNTTPWNE